jgi:hypothetical protein
MKPGETFAEIQPKDGDMVLFCRHIEVLPGLIDFHGCQTRWVAFEVPAEVQGVNINDGEMQLIMARFVCLCEECFLKDPVKFSEIAQHGRWIGNEPIIVQEAVS